MCIEKVFHSSFEWEAHQRSSNFNHKLKSSAQLRPILLAKQLKNQLLWAALIEARNWSSGFWANAIHQLLPKIFWTTMA